MSGSDNAAPLLDSDRAPDGLQKDSDYSKMGMKTAPLFVVYTAILMTFAGIGVAISAALYQLSPRSLALETLRSYNLGPVYLAVFLMRLAFQLINANLGMARRSTRCNVPDQHVYRVYGGAGDGALVLMNDAGPFGPFNRAQRALANFEEYMAFFCVQLCMAGFVFPWTALVCSVVIGAGRLKSAVDYTKDRNSRIGGNMLSFLALGVLDGAGLFVGIVALIK